MSDKEIYKHFVNKCLVANCSCYECPYHYKPECDEINERGVELLEKEQEQEVIDSENADNITG